MFVRFYASIGKDFDDHIAAAFQHGCAENKVACEIVSTEHWKLYPCDARLAVVVGVKGHSKEIFDAYRRAGRHVVFIDKGYTRIGGGPLGTLYFRFSLDAFQPLAYFQTSRPSDRWEQLGIPIATSRARGVNVVFAGSSQKYCNWHGLGPATVYAEEVFRQIRACTGRPLVYRPKPTWKDAVPIVGTRFSTREDKFNVELEKAHVVVTHGSNACFEAMIHGVPALVLGEAVTRPLCSTSLIEVPSPRYPKQADLYQLAYDLAYCQCTLDEMASGWTWLTLKQILKTL